MRITIVSGSVPTTTFIDALINTMAENGFSITVVGKQTGVYSYHKNVKVIVVPSGFLNRVWFVKKLLLLTGFKYFGKIASGSEGLKDLFHNLLYYLPIIYSRPDKVHLQWTAFVHDRDLLFDLFPNKILVSLRGAHINYTPITTPAIKESYLRLLPQVYKFHAVSKAIVKEAEQYGVAKEKTDIIYSMVSDELIQKEIKPKEATDTLQIISVGRFFWKKGYTYAIDTMHKLMHNGVAFSYTIIAEGEVPADIKYQIHQLNLSGYIRIINGAEHEVVLKEIAAHDVLILPSVEEGIANVVLEAMAVGTPVICTKVGGMQEVITHEKNGFVVPVRDIVAMKDAIADFAKKSKLERFEIAKAAKQTISEQHNKKEFTEKFKQFYQS